MIDGRAVEPRDLADTLTAAMLEAIRVELAERVGSIRDPDTGEFPTVVVSGDSIDSLTLQVEGSPKLVALAKERLGMADPEADSTALPAGVPRVFLSYTSDNVDLARRVAEALQAGGIETWWDRWCIGPGDSLRQKIDEGIGSCTHFLVLLTPESIHQPWVNQEMDAGLVRRLRQQCRFVPVRYGLSSSLLPPLLSGMHSPKITADSDVSQLIDDIHGVCRKPPLGRPPAAVETSVASHTGYSAAATMIAKLFVERSQHGLFGDPQISVADVASEAKLSREDTEDALHELSAFVKTSHDFVLVQGALFAEFDRFWKPWKPADDALRLAADIVNDPAFPAACEEIAVRYGWEPRRLNSAIAYLLKRRLIRDRRVLGNGPWDVIHVVGNDDMRRFVKSRT